jgi:ferredoxin
LLDFGLASGLASELVSRSTVDGRTLAYAPVEQLFCDENTIPTPLWDIYSVGATLYHLITGQFPVQSGVRFFQMSLGKPDPFLPPLEKNTNIPVSISNVICRAMALNSDDRFRTIADFRNELSACSSVSVKPETIGNTWYSEQLGNEIAPKFFVEPEPPNSSFEPESSTKKGKDKAKPELPEFIFEPEPAPKSRKRVTGSPKEAKKETKKVYRISSTEIGGSSLARFDDAFPDNVSGPFYVDTQCIDCDVCRDTAPSNFSRNDDAGYSYVYKQPESDEELEQCREAMDACPVEAIGSDGY